MVSLLQLALLAVPILASVLPHYHYDDVLLLSEQNDFLVNAEAIDTAWEHLQRLPDLQSRISETQRWLNQKPSSRRPQTESTDLNPDFHVLSQDNYSLRSKSVESLGLDTVALYAGYFDTDDDKHFFYWFFESRNDPSTDPVLLWLNGGPGCASDAGLFFELGPSSIGPDLKPVYNPYSWNSNASVIFLDQPIGVGYSYGEDEEDIDTTPKAAKDVYVFLDLFFKRFSQFLPNPFHVSGESYAGHYIPRIAAEILRHPERTFRLDSMIVGNGAVDRTYQHTYDQKMVCGEGGITVLSPENCTQMQQYLDRCILFQSLCTLTKSVIACVPQSYYCELAYGPLHSLNLNPYDLRRPCENEGLCYNEMSYLVDYMNLDHVKEVLGVPSSKSFQDCSGDVGKRFDEAFDRLKPFQKYIAEVLESGVPVLHYAGDKDFQCHWLGYNAVSNTIDYSEKENFRASEFGPWISSGEELGQIRGYGNFTFVKVYDAGHMVPHDQPKAALELLNTWLNGGLKL